MDDVSEGLALTGNPPGLVRNSIRPPSRFFRRVSTWKLTAGLACLGLAVYFLTPPFIYVESERAVTNAPIVTLRTPIPGTVTVLSGAGRRIAKGERLASISNEHWDPSPLFDTEGRLQAAKARRQAAQEEAATLVNQRDGLRRDYTLWLETATSAAQHLLSETRIQLGVAEVRRKTAANILARYQKLADQQYVNHQRLDEARRDGIVTARDVIAMTEQVGRAEAQARALAGGITAGENDRPPTLQRLDEIAMRLAALSAEIDASTETVGKLTTERDARVEQARIATESVLTAPTDGLVWRLFGADREEVPANAAIANLIDCKATDVTALFLQRHLDSLVAGRQVSVKLAGRRNLLFGRIASVNGYYDNDARTADAVVMKPSTSPSVLVRVTLDEPVPGCLVGLEGVVRLDR